MAKLDGSTSRQQPWSSIVTTQIERIIYVELRDKNDSSYRCDVKNLRSHKKKHVSASQLAPALNAKNKVDVLAYALNFYCFAVICPVLNNVETNEPMSLIFCDYFMHLRVIFLDGLFIPWSCSKDGRGQHTIFEQSRARSLWSVTVHKACTVRCSWECDGLSRYMSDRT